MQTIDQMGRRGILCPTMGQRVLVAGTEAPGVWVPVPSMTSLVPDARKAIFGIDNNSVLPRKSILRYTNLTIQSIQIGSSVIVSIKTLAGCMSSSAIRPEM